LPLYQQLETVQEIAMIDSDNIYAEVHRRAGTQWMTELLRGSQAILTLASVGIDIPLAELYGGTGFAEPKG